MRRRHPELSRTPLGRLSDAFWTLAGRLPGTSWRSLVGFRGLQDMRAELKRSSPAVVPFCGLSNTTTTTTTITTTSDNNKHNNNSNSNNNNNNSNINNNKVMEEVITMIMFIEAAMVKICLWEFV